MLAITANVRREWTASKFHCWDHASKESQNVHIVAVRGDVCACLDVLDEERGRHSQWLCCSLSKLTGQINYMAIYSIAGSGGWIFAQR